MPPWGVARWVLDGVADATVWVTTWVTTRVTVGIAAEAMVASRQPVPSRSGSFQLESTSNGGSFVAVWPTRLSSVEAAAG